MMLKAIIMVSVAGCVLGCAPPPTQPPVKIETTTRPANSTNCECGRANRGRIINGQDADANEFPWQVGLHQGGGGKPFCGGSIIGKKHVVTAAHCIVGGQMYVAVGDHSLSSREERYVRVCNIKKHPNYSSKDYENDYAVLTLCEPLEFSVRVQPVCLPSGEGRGAEYEGVDAIVSGWGKTQSGGQPDKLQKLETRTMDNERCRSMLPYAAKSSIKDVTLCAHRNGTSACNGDSGGPLVTEESNGRFTLIGIASFTILGCPVEYPTMYARVSQMMTWITEGVDYCTA